MKERGGKKDERSAISGRKIHRKIKKSKKDKEVRNVKLISPIFYCPENVVCILTSAAYIQVHFRLDFTMDANTINPDQTAPWQQSNQGPYIVQYQAFRFMVGPGHCPMISKYGLSLSKAVGPVDPSFLVVKKSHFNKTVHLTASLQKTCTCRLQYSKTCFKQPLKKRQNKILITNGSLMKVKRSAECSPLGAFCNPFDLH